MHLVTQVSSKTLGRRICGYRYGHCGDDGDGINLDGRYGDRRSVGVSVGVNVRVIDLAYRVA